MEDPDNTRAGKRTKQKLAQMMNAFDDFEGVMKEGTRQRREKDEHRLAQLKNEMGTLEKTMSSEIKRRLEMSKSFQSWCESQIAAFQDRMEVNLRKRNVELQANIDKLNARVDALEEKFEEDKLRMMQEIEERNARLTKQLNEFQAIFDAEVKSRLEREAKIAADLAEAEAETKVNFETERTHRETVYQGLKTKLDDAIRSRTKGDEKFQAFVAEEIASIKNAIRKEQDIREQEDDEIVDTLNRYTQKLQASLQIINSSDT